MQSAQHACLHHGGDCCVPVRAPIHISYMTQAPSDPMQAFTNAFRYGAACLFGKVLTGAQSSLLVVEGRAVHQDRSRQ